MEVTVISNGSLKIVMCPASDNPIDQNAIKQIKGKTLMVKVFDQPTQILDKPAPNAAVLTIIPDIPTKEEKIIPDLIVIIDKAQGKYVGVIQAGPDLELRIMKHLQSFNGPTYTISKIQTNHYKAEVDDNPDTRLEFITFAEIPS